MSFHVILYHSTLKLMLEALRLDKAASAVSNSWTVRAVWSFLGLIGSFFIFCSIHSLWTAFILMYTVTALFKWCQSEKCCRNFDMAATGAGSVTVVAKTSISFLTFGSSVEISPSNSGGAGHAFSGCHRNSGPVNQRCCSVSVLRSKPWDASSLCVYVTPLVRVELLCISWMQLQRKPEISSDYFLCISEQ